MMNLSADILSVYEQGTSIPSYLDTPHSLVYEYCSGRSPNGLSAWEDGGKTYVNESCRPLDGGFRQQALNRAFSKLLMRHKFSSVLVFGVEGSTLDIFRVAKLMGVSVILVINPKNPPPMQLFDSSFVWGKDALTCCSSVFILDGEDLHRDAWISNLEPMSKQVALSKYEQLDILKYKPKGESVSSFNYSYYEFGLRDHPLLMSMQEPDTRHFEGCNNVLDLGCGAGIFLQLLKEKGIPATGVERNLDIASYGRGMGLDITTADALGFLKGKRDAFDGIYCSHFVEHLPFELVQNLIQLLASSLNVGGTLVLTFPDPESIRSQLLGFWRDPEHVRFYHPELISTLAQSYGLDCTWTSYDEQPHKVISFPEKPAEAPSIPVFPSFNPAVAKKSWLQRLLSTLGVATTQDVMEQRKISEHWEKAFKEQNLHSQAVVETMQENITTLWEVNETWAWNDNATLKFTKT